LLRATRSCTHLAPSENISWLWPGEVAHQQQGCGRKYIFFHLHLTPGADLACRHVAITAQR